MSQHDTRRYKQELFEEQRGLCAWPPCRKPLDLQTTNHVERAEVDHNHRCCDTAGRTCGKCVRGLVHMLCNVKDIRWMDRAIDRGFNPPPGSIGEYLTIGEVNCRGESYLRPGDYEPFVASAEDVYLYEHDYADQLRRLRENYPFFSAQVLDDLSIDELTRQSSRYGFRRLSRRTVMYRLQEEKARFLEEVNSV